VGVRKGPVGLSKVTDGWRVRGTHKCGGELNAGGSLSSG